MNLKIFTILLILSVSYRNTFSQTLNKSKLDSLFDRLAEKDKAMGSICISKNGKVLYSRAIGFSVISDKEKKPANTTSKYRIGSITKMFTATMILQLIEEGKLKIGTTLDTYFPQLPNAKLITIGNLLNHRSGLHNFTSDPNYLTWNTQPKTQDEILKLIAANTVDFMPNEKGEYSNSNYVVLGFIIEKISGLSYEKNLKMRITSKIGLKNTYVGAKINPALNECYSYEYSGSWKQEPETDMTVPCGAGNILSTPTDLTMFIDALFNFKLISKNSLLQMKTMTDDFGMGMFQYPFYNKKSYGHTGGIDGFRSILNYFPDDSLSVAYTINGQVYPMNDVLIGVLSIYYNMPYTIPAFYTNTTKAEDLDKYLGVYASAELPLKITITKDSNVLIAQATGQASFALEAAEKDIFRYDQAGIILEFNTAKNQMTLKQGGGTYLFTKDK